MRSIVISVQNSLLATLIKKSILERGEMLPEVVTGSSLEDLVQTCQSCRPDVILLEFSCKPPFDCKTRLEQIHTLRQAAPKCRIAGLCDDQADQDLAEQLVSACKSKLIDNFFYMSVSGEYLAASLEVM